ncbi:MAG: alpha-L-fucosidase [Tannerella sp.]|jgi:alpha-L-fucosidase|nr:alpha-L-fucosidase [Tannerella sp.]
MKILLFLFLSLGRFDLPLDSIAATEALSGWWAESQKQLDRRMAWYNEAKFGCFIHWGVYSLAGGEWQGAPVRGYAEHLMRIKKIPLEQYKQQLVEPFNPVDFDAEEWMRHARDAGMKYFIVTAKHHDGFAMYFSDAYPYDMRQTAFNRDPMRELRAAARKYGLKFGFYYSHAFDWEHPDAPGNDWDYDNPGGDKNRANPDWWLWKPDFLPRADKYVTEKSIPQILELIRLYKPDIMWFDTPAKLPLYQNIRILKAIREVAPETLVINGRLARFGAQNLGDYANTGDRAAYFPPVQSKYWESIPTTNESYGYSRYDLSHKPAAHFIRLLASAAAKGGNILMNVGPMGNGKWDEIDVNIFKEIGAWLKINGSSIYGVTSAGIPQQNWGVITRKNNSLYLHVYKYPAEGKLIIGGLSAYISKAYLLASKKPVSIAKLGDNDMILTLPMQCPDTVNTVVVLNLKKSEFRVGDKRLLEPDDVNELLVFDADVSKGLSFGDGKTNRNYIANWNSSDRTIQWKVRLLKPASYAVSINYNKVAATDAGTVFVEIDGKDYVSNYSPSAKLLESEQIDICTVTLDAGEHTIILKGGNFNGSQYLRPMSLLLKPLENR